MQKRWAFRCLKISGLQKSWGYENGPWKEPEPPLLVAADLLGPL